MWIEVDSPQMKTTTKDKAICKSKYNMNNTWAGRSFCFRLLVEAVDLQSAGTEAWPVISFSVEKIGREMGLSGLWVNQIVKPNNEIQTNTARFDT